MDKLNSLFADKKTTFWSICALITAVVVVTQVVIPQVQAFQEVSNQLKQLQVRLQVLQTKYSQLQAFDEVEGEKNMQVLLTVLPVSDEIPIALMTVQDYLTRSGLILENANYSGQKSKQTNSVTIKILAKGNILGVRTFLANLKDTPRLFQVESINVHYASTDGSVEADLPLSTFYEPLPKSLGGIDKPLPQLSASDKTLLDKLTASVGQAPVISEASTAAVPLGKDNPFQ